MTTDRPFSRETDLTPRTGVGGPITDEDRLFAHRLSNPGQSDLERIIRADERRRVAEEIAQAIEVEAATRKAATYVDSGQDYPIGLLAVAAEIARKHREVSNG